MSVKTGVDLIRQIRSTAFSDDYANVGICDGPDVAPVRIGVASEDGEATVWMTAHDALELAQAITGVANRALRENKQEAWL